MTHEYSIPSFGIAAVAAAKAQLDAAVARAGGHQ
jgi:hypothetical protein